MDDAPSHRPRMRILRDKLCAQTSELSITTPLQNLAPRYKRARQRQQCLALGPCLQPKQPKKTAPSSKGHMKLPPPLSYVYTTSTRPGDWSQTPSKLRLSRFICVLHRAAPDVHFADEPARSSGMTLLIC